LAPHHLNDRLGMAKFRIREFAQQKPPLGQANFAEFLRYSERSDTEYAGHGIDSKSSRLRGTRITAYSNLGALPR
jgi:hypothetical protein